MARILALKKDTSGACPGDAVVVTAITEPPDTPVTWFVDGEEASVPNPATFRDFHIGPQNQLVEARLDDSSDTVIVEGKIAGLSLELDPPPTAGKYFITDEPEPPSITVTAIGVGGSPSALQWDITVAVDATLTKELCAPNAPAGIEDSFDFSPTESGQQIAIDFAGLVRGSRLSIAVTGMVNGCPVKAFAGSLRIGGTNPGHGDVEASLPHDTLRAIACYESGQRQFDAPASGGTGLCPLFGAAGEVGIMQIADASQDEIWDWRKNVATGITLFEEFTKRAQGYPGRVRESAGFKKAVDHFNQGRQSDELAALNVMLPDFTSGNFDNDLQQLERDAIRGYDGWHGTDRFGHELHEFEVAFTTVGVEEILRVDETDELARTGVAVWERVPPNARPLGVGDANYVDGVMALLAGCGGNQQPTHSCLIKIQPLSAKLRSFDPPALEPVVSIKAIISSSSTLPSDRRINWCLDTTIPEFRGSLVIDKENALSVSLSPRRPGLARLVAQVHTSDQPTCSDTPICRSHHLDLSVPQFFHVVFEAGFSLDLERLGLKRRPPSNGSPLTPAQLATNELVGIAVMNVALETARGIYADSQINVRFTVDDPTEVVGEKNFSTVSVSTTGPVESGRSAEADFPFGFAKRDPGNTVPDGIAFVLSEEFTNRKHDSLGLNETYLAIFDELAVEQLDGTSISGTPIDAGEFVSGGGTTRRQRLVEAAVIAVGRFVGCAIAHECGHLMGLNDDKTEEGKSHLMGRADFNRMTGITSFDTTTGKVQLEKARRLKDVQASQLFKILPILS